MKRLSYASAAVLMLSLAFHFGYTTAKAQAPGNPVVGLVKDPNAFYFSAVTANGDIYDSVGSSAASQQHLLRWPDARAAGVVGPGEVPLRPQVDPGPPFPDGPIVANDI